MSFQIENSLKSVVSATLAVVLTLIVMTGISSGIGPQQTHHQSLGAHSPVAALARHAR